MVFNDISNKSGMIQECETWLFGSDYGSISGNTNNLATFTRLINSGVDQTETEIMKVDGNWQWDDKNHGDKPSATTTLVNGQADYTLDMSHMKVIGVEVKDSDGNYRPISPIDYTEIRKSGTTESEFFETDAMPVYYDLKGDILTLFPAPATGQVTMSAGLRIVFQREADYFTSSDTTKELGIPRIFHDVPVLFACAKYAKANSMGDKARELDAELTRRVKDLKEFFTKRNLEGNKIITMKSTPAY